MYHVKAHPEIHVPVNQDFQQTVHGLPHHAIRHVLWIPRAASHFDDGAHGGHESVMLAGQHDIAVLYDEVGHGDFRYLDGLQEQRSGHSRA